MRRTVAAETLDALPPDDPAARRSRRDLVRVHLAMGTRGLMARALRDAPPEPADARPLELLELGAGDGTLMLAVARKLAARWPRVRLTLLDRVDILAARTRDAYAALGWEVRVRECDVLDWADDATAPRSDLVLTTLFLHHFEGAELDRLLAGIATRTDRFHAVEPRRDRVSLLGSRLVALLGANAVTREDAVLSVRAGFTGHELSARWPGASDWRLRETRAGPFGHGFHARREGGP